MQIRYKCEVPGCNITVGRKDKLRAHIQKQHKDLPKDKAEEFFQRLREIPLPSFKEYYETESAKSNITE